MIGKRCRHVPRRRAPEVIAGYLRRQRRVACATGSCASRPGRSASRSTRTARSGPWLTTADEVGDPHGLGIRTWVNGELRQSSNTKELIFDCYALVEHLSTAFTLEVGDVIATGTPGGVGIAMKPPRLLAGGRRGADRDRRPGRAAERGGPRARGDRALLARVRGDMKYGIAIFPTDYVDHPGASSRARREARGFESLWFPEHSHIPASRRTPFPGGGDLPKSTTTCTSRSSRSLRRRQ